MSGLVHINCGDGKGKTTACVGLAVRAAGAGKKVLFVQFLKDGNSSEIENLKKTDGISVCTVDSHHGFLKFMCEEEQIKTCENHKKMFEEILKRAQNNIDLLILDEVISACNLKVIQEEKLVCFLKEKPEKLEVVLTGKEPSDKLISLADYVTEMKKIKHPYDKGIQARRGIEF